MKHLKKADLFAVILCLCAVIPGLAVWSRLPDRVPAHWDLNGEVNGTMPKAVSVFGMPVLFAAVTLICCFCVRLIETKQSLGKAGTVQRFLFPVVLYFIQALTLLYALGRLRDVRCAAYVFGSVFLILLGNYLPKVRQNGLIGIRTPHTLSSEKVWHRTHRLAGFTVTAGGVAALAVSLLGSYTLMIVIMLVSLVIPAVYGEIVWYRSRAEQQ